MEVFDWLWAATEPLAAPKELPRSLLRVNMKLKVAQKSATERFESFENDLKIQNVNVLKTIKKTQENLLFLKNSHDYFYDNVLRHSQQWWYWDIASYFGLIPYETLKICELPQLQKDEIRI